MSLCDVLGAAIQWHQTQQQQSQQQQSVVTSPAALAKKTPSAVSLLLLTIHFVLYTVDWAESPNCVCVSVQAFCF